MMQSNFSDSIRGFDHRPRVHRSPLRLEARQGSQVDGARPLRLLFVPRLTSGPSRRLAGLHGSQRHHRPHRRVYLLRLGDSSVVRIVSDVAGMKVWNDITRAYI